MIRGLFRRLIRQGTLTVFFPDGTREEFGSGRPRAAIRFRDRKAMLRLMLNPELAFGELYMDGGLVPEGCSIAEVLDLVVANLARSGTSGPARFIRAVRRALRRLEQFNPARRARRNVAHHYDLSGALFDLFLDKDKQYSCAYFSQAGESLDEAQTAKKRHIAAKLHLDRPGLKVLDIGSGWGGLALDLARDGGANVLGCTLSQEQFAVANERARQAGLAERVKFGLIDYRELGGRFDRIVSVGMFEHVGAPHYDAFFAKVKSLLADDGTMLLHTIGRSDGPGTTNPWIAKYIFPGGYVPALSEVLAAVERSGLIVTDVEILRLHYAQTCKEWRRRFVARWDEAAGLYDERFCRMWEFYLAGAEMAFRHDGQVVFQIQLACHNDALPITRDYMVDDERAMKSEQTPRRLARRMT
jgi:cyclopropane-fatty-acyl-phospholipid synthase